MKSWKFKYTGKMLSINNLTVSSLFKKLKNQLKIKLMRLLWEQDLPQLERFGIVARVNSNHDIDNVTATAKIFVDNMKIKTIDDKYNKTIIPEDDKKHYRYLLLIVDESQDDDTVEFEVRKLTKRPIKNIKL